MINKPAINLTVGLAGPALRTLLTSGITSLEKLATYTEVEIKHLHGIGPNAMGKLKSALLENGLSFRVQTTDRKSEPPKGNK